MTLRTDQRNELVRLLTATGTWQAVYDHQPGDFQQQSPVATVHGGGVAEEAQVFGDDVPHRVRLLVTNFVRRAEPESPATAEDTLDTLLEKVLDTAASNYSGSVWTSLDLDGITEPDYYVVDGVQYRGEIITLAATVW